MLNVKRLYPRYFSQLAEIHKVTYSRIMIRSNGELRTAAEVIDALGGTQDVADMFAVGYGAAWNWRVRGLPSDTYAAMQAKLIRKGYFASPALWSQRESR